MKRLLSSVLVCGCLILSIFVTDIYAYGDNIGTSNYMDNESVLYRRGPNIVTSREVNQYRYEGYMHLDSTYKYGGRYIDVGGWIRYTQGDREEKRYARRVGSDIYEAHLTFYDTINPFASKTRFSYDITTRDIGGSVAYRAAESVSNEFHQTGEIILDR